MFRATFSLSVLIALACLTPRSAHAVCANPAGSAGDQIYNTTYSVMQYCNGTNWIGMGGGGQAPVGVSGTAGAVQYSDGTTLAADPTNLFWDDTANRLGVGTDTPSTMLHVNGAATATSFIGDGSGLTGVVTTESDPTVDASVKDGVDWSELSGIPAGFSDGTDDVGLTAETDPRIGTLTNGKWCSTDGSSVNCTSDAPAGLPTPPVCNLSNRALQWDGSNWSCATIAGGGGGGPTIVNGDHTQQDCLDAGGTINTVDFGGDVLCTFSGFGCPGGWTNYGRYKRNAKSCSGSATCNPGSCTLAGGWISNTGARTCNYKRKAGFSCQTETCSQSNLEGVTDTACY